MSREAWSCRYCASSVRFRSVIHALSSELFSTSLAIKDFPERHDLTGVGFSDWDGYANRLPGRLGYTNTYYHKAPLLDITNIEGMPRGQYDFIISSDVYEHICQPISKAFQNAHELLKPGGVMILTVPYVGGETQEHFPGITRFDVNKEGDEWVLNGQTPDGQRTKFKNITFHGGPGTTVEFRLFGEESMLRDCRAAGFEDIRVHREQVPKFGIYWNPYSAQDAPYRPLIYGLDTPPWALVKHAAPVLARQDATRAADEGHG